MLKRLNGWQRVWFVAVTVGLFYTAWFALSDGVSQYNLKGEILLAYGKPECKTIIAMRAGQELEPPPSLDSPCWDLYLYRSIYKNAGANSEAYAHHMGSLQRTRALQTFGFSLIVWFLAVALLYFIGVVVAWIRRGFYSTPPQ